MLDKFFEELLTQLDDKYQDKIEQFSKNEPELGSVAKSYGESLRQLVDANKQMVEAQQNNQPLTEESYNSLVRYYNEFLENSKKLLEIQEGAQISGDETMANLFAKVENLVYPAQHYLNEIQAKGLGVNLSEVYADKKWISHMFAADPNKDKLKGEATEDIEAADSLSGNIIMYVDKIQELKTKYDEHMKVVTQSKGDPEESLKVKAEMINGVFMEANGDDKSAFNPRSLYNVHKEMERHYHPGNLQQLTRNDFINSNFFEFASENLLNMILLSEHVENSRLNEKNQKYVIDAYKKMNLKPANLGISPNDLQVLDKATSQLGVFDQIRISINLAIRSKAFSNRSGGITPAINKLNEIDAALINVMSGNSTDVPSKEIGELMGALAEYANNHPRFNNSGVEDDLVSACIICCDLLDKNFHGIVGERYETLRSNFRTTANQQYRQNYLELGATVPGLCGKYFNIGKTYISEGFIDEAEYDKLYAMRMAKDPNFRNREVEKALNAVREYGTDKPRQPLSEYYGAPFKDEIRSNPEKMMKACAKTLVLGYLFKKEEIALRAYAAAEEANPNQFSNELKCGFNPKLLDAVCGSPMNPQNIQEFEAQIEGFLGSNAVRQLIDKKPEEIKASFAGDSRAMLEQTLFGDSAQFDSRLTPETMDAISTVKKGPKKSNSESYTTMVRQVDDFVKSGHQPGGHSLNDYANLYNSLRNYVNTHDSEPFTNHGKQRFNAAAVLLCDVGAKIMKMRPNSEAALRIEKDFRVNMIRSKIFREACTQTAVEQNMPELGNMARDIGASLAREGKEMITGKADYNSKKVEDALLEKYAGIKPAARVRN